MAKRCITPEPTEDPVVKRASTESEELDRLEQNALDDDEPEEGFSDVPIRDKDSWHVWLPAANVSVQK